MFAIWEEGTSMQENLSQKILDLLDSGRFLTLKEIAKLLKMPEKPVEETLLHLVRLLSDHSAATGDQQIKCSCR